MDNLRDGLLGDADGKIRLLRRLVDVVDAREALNLSTASGGVHATTVGLLAVLERGSYVHNEDISTSTSGVGDCRLEGRATILMRRNGCCDDCRTGPRQLGCDEGDALQMLVALIGQEAELGRKLRTDRVAQQKRYAATAMLIEDGLESASNGVLAGVVQSSQEDDETLLGSWRIAFTERLDDLSEGQGERKK